MDIFSHMLWSGALGRVAKDKQPRVSVGWSTWWGVFPDLFAFVPAMLAGFWTSYQLSGSLFSTEAVQFRRMALAWDLYQISHSFITFLAIFLLVLGVRKVLKRQASWSSLVPYSLLGWPFHILLDIPTHRLGFFATPFLWPVSSYRFPYGTSWGEPWFMVCNLIALLTIYAWLWRKHRTVVPAHSNTIV